MPRALNAGAEQATDMDIVLDDKQLGGQRHAPRLEQLLSPVERGRARECVECAVERQNIDPVFSEEAEQRRLDVATDQRLDGAPLQAARSGNAIDLRQSRFGANMGVEPRSGGSHQIGGDRLSW